MVLARLSLKSKFSLAESVFDLVSVWNRQHVVRGVEKQLVLTCCRWSPLMQQLVSLVYPMFEPSVVIADPFEAACVAQTPVGGGGSLTGGEALAEMLCEVLHCFR